MIQVTNTITKSKEDYLKIAIELGINDKWRQSIVNKIKKNISLLYNDLKPVKVLETFYENIVNNKYLK